MRTEAKTADPVIDLSDCRTAEDAARRTHEAIVGWIRKDRKSSDEMGMKYRGPREENVYLRSPEDTGLVMDEYAEGHWHVAWEEGPFEWAVWLAGGEQLYRGEGMKYGPVMDLPTRGCRVECARSWVLTFYDD